MKVLLLHGRERLVPAGHTAAAAIGRHPPLALGVERGRVPVDEPELGILALAGTDADTLIELRQCGVDWQRRDDADGTEHGHELCELWFATAVVCRALGRMVPTSLSLSLHSSSSLSILRRLVLSCPAIHRIKSPSLITVPHSLFTVRTPPRYRA